MEANVRHSQPRGVASACLGSVERLVRLDWPRVFLTQQKSGGWATAAQQVTLVGDKLRVQHDEAGHLRLLCDCASVTSPMAKSFIPHHMNLSRR
ncbi:hypothetical protein [Mesorhizobium sp. B2-4-6]|uniref:hypothetical protein n=1 Tax=Mesorhizobium sp. B2-4-6 TaxID=2589943 RepID=UPI00112C75B4|nr:hypothetical protein [Mesorhizobium sp. B2-4-6]TPL49914.1 hypothetical protein FJ957_12735 [Mesorhizobium sp. B2-4-6]